MPKISNRSYNALLERLNEYVQKHDGRNSPVRLLVLNVACTLNQPFTADKLVDACAEHRISKGTVYNTLNLFVDAHILHVSESRLGRSHAEYELMVGSSLRMHTICYKCGRITALHNAALTAMIKNRQYTNFIPQHISLFIYGECKTCKTKPTSL